MTGAFVVPAQTFTALSTGAGGANAVELLGRAQVSRRLQLIRVIADTAPEAAGLRPAIEVLARAQRTAPLAAAGLLRYPWIGSWASRTVSRLCGGTVPAGALSLDMDLQQLNSVAVVAASVARVNADLPVPVLDGQVVLPSLGTSLDDRLPTGARQASVRGGRVTIDGDLVLPAEPGGERVTSWRPPWRLAGAGGKTVDLADRDPYRDCFDMTLDYDVPADRVQGWQRLFSDAWELLAAHCPGRVDELHTGLLSMVPLARTVGEPGLSATSRDAFGALALTEPFDAPALAASLVHEFQHSKLSALLDLIPLYDRRSSEMYFAPWRADPRPLGGLLQGIYAFTAVAETWLAFRNVPALRDRAHRQFAELQAQLAEAMPALRAAPSLTPAGASFVDGVAAALAPLLAERMMSAHTTTAREALSTAKLRWRLRNRLADPERVRALVAAYLADPSTVDIASGAAPADLEGWVLALQTDPPEQEPELLYAVHRGLRSASGRSPDLDALARWLAGAIRRPPPAPGR
jgi:HEXXH motif-containing protein